MTKSKKEILEGYIEDLEVKIIQQEIAAEVYDHLHSKYNNAEDKSTSNAAKHNVKRFGTQLEFLRELLKKE